MTIVKSLTLGLICFFVVVTTYGQTNRFDIGFESCPSITTMRGNYRIYEFQKTTVGFSNGLFFQYNFKNIVSLRTDIAHERKGTVRILSVSYGGDSEKKWTLHNNFDYLVIPIFIRTTIGKKIKFFIEAGSFFGYLIKQTYVSKCEIFETTIYDKTYLYKRYDYGFSTGLGISVPIKQRFAMTFELRENLGLFDVSSPDYSIGPLKTNSINFLFCFAYKFGQRIVNK